MHDLEDGAEHDTKDDAGLARRTARIRAAAEVKTMEAEERAAVDLRVRLLPSRDTARGGTP